jgi:hypothetical protein
MVLCPSRGFGHLRAPAITTSPCFESCENHFSLESTSLSKMSPEKKVYFELENGTVDMVWSLAALSFYWPIQASIKFTKKKGRRMQMMAFNSIQHIQRRFGSPM